MLGFIKELTGILSAVTIMFFTVFGSIFFIDNKVERRNCTKYMEATGVVTKYVEYDTCYMLDVDRFVSKKEFVTRQQAQNVNLSKGE